MKFQDMPYERVNFTEIEKEFRELIREFESAGSGQEQFEIHKKYYRLTGHVNTMMTVASIRHDINTADS